MVIYGRIMERKAGSPGLKSVEQLWDNRRPVKLIYSMVHNHFDFMMYYLSRLVPMLGL